MTTILQTINENEVSVFAFGLYTLCHSCQDVVFLSDYNDVVIIYRANCDKCLFHSQSGFLTDQSMSDITNKKDVIINWLYNGSQHGKSFISHYLKIPHQIEEHINLLEDVCILGHQILISRNLMDRYIAVVNFCKLRGSRIGFTTSIMYVVADLFGSMVTKDKTYPFADEIHSRVEFETQSGEDENIFATLRENLHMYEKMKETPIYKKLYKFMLYVMTLGLLDGVKIDFKHMNFSKYEEAAIRRTHRPGCDMVYTMLETVLFVCDKGTQYFKTGDASVFMHSGSSYEKWLVKAQNLVLQSKFLSNPEPHGINKFQYLADLKECIEKGEALIKYTTGADKAEKLYAQKILGELRMVEAEETTKRSAQQTRKDPFAVLVHGSSGIGKSQLKSILFYHYGKVFGYPVASEYLYTRCPTDEYWSGFNSTQWCIVMDDIAFLKPNGEVDPTLKELLQVKNSTPYTPPQAALEDKGRTPVKAELLIATTNTRDLNLHAYFSCPYAIARRLPFIITPTVKPEYTKNGFMLDPSLVPPTPEGEYMDVWNFLISVPIPAHDDDRDGMNTKYREIARFENIDALLCWYIEMARVHNNNQAKALAADKIMMDVKICQGCSMRECICTTGWVSQADMPEGDIPESINIDDFTPIMKFKLYIIDKVCKGEPEDIPTFVEDFINNDWSMFYPALFLIFICTLWFNFVTFFFLYLFVYLLFKFVYYIYVYFFFIVHFVMRYRYGFMWKYKLLYKICGNESDTYRLMFRYMGQRVKKLHFYNPKLKYLALFVSNVAFITVFCKIMRSVFASSNYKDGTELTKESVTPSKLSSRMRSKLNKTDAYTEQSNTGTSPVPMEYEKPTFYYQDPYKSTGVEISGASRAVQGDIVDKRIRRNIASLILRFDGITDTIVTTALNVSGSLWLFNKHAIKGNAGFVDVIREDIEQNVSQTIRNIQFTGFDIVCSAVGDLAIINLPALPPGPDLIKYFALDQLKGRYAGKYFMIHRTGVRKELMVANVSACKEPITGMPGYLGYVEVPTQKGDCGSPLMLYVGDSRVIAGIHTGGDLNTRVSLQSVTQSMLKCLIAKFGPQIQSGSLPISAEGCERKIIDLNAKSSLRFISSGTAEVIGSFAGYRPHHKSKVQKTFIADYVVDNGYNANFGAPKMNWEPWHLALKDMTSPIFTFTNQNLRKCGDAFLADILGGLGNKINQLEVYTQDVALNGVDGVTYVDRLNCSTSAGNPFKTTKKKFLTMDENNKITGVDKVIQNRINEIENCYSNKTRFHPQFCGHLKDEPTSQKKILAGKTRVFTGGEMAWSIVVRRYLLSHIRLMQNNPFIFESMPGVVAQSIEWERLYKYITKHGEDRIIAGDYGKFDKRMAAPFILEAFRILEEMSKQAGWNEEDLGFIRCIAYDTAFPSIDFNGDLIEIQGNPSGHPLTVIINCLVNSLYMRYAYMLVADKDVTTFKQHVNLATYGDDNIMSVSKGCSKFNHTAISAALKVIGVDYTMAEKEATSVPFIHIDDASFLKRKFVYNVDVGAIVAPLDPTSFDKMLTSCVKSDDLSPQAHSICVIETALREYFFYGREVFEERKQFFKQLICDCKLEQWVRPSTIPEFDVMTYEFWMRFGDEKNALKYGIKPSSPRE